MAAKRRRRAPQQRYARPAYRWTDDLDVILGVLALAGTLAYAFMRAQHGLG